MTTKIQINNGKGTVHVCNFHVHRLISLYRKVELNIEKPLDNIYWLPLPETVKVKDVSLVDALLSQLNDDELYLCMKSIVNDQFTPMRQFFRQQAPFMKPALEALFLSYYKERLSVKTNNP